jgi:DNA polymerase III subunit delta'
MTEKTIEDFPWLKPACAALDARLAADRLPHALLLHGQVGTGRNQLARWLAGRLLGVPVGLLSTHPDCCEVGLDSERTQITVAQVRTLVEFLSLTAGGARKVALVTPAEAMNVSAANALLKTLEEPAGNAVIILVADSPRRLPLTVTSRCQRLRLPTPAPAEALAWLRQREPGVDWTTWLTLAGGAPAAAVALRAAAGADDAFLSALPADLAALARRDEGPVAIARRWTKVSASLALTWLEAQVTSSIRQAAGVAPPPGLASTPLQKPSAEPNIRDWFSYRDRIQRVRRQLAHGLNDELQVADLLMFWTSAARRGA